MQLKIWPGRQIRLGTLICCLGLLVLHAPFFVGILQAQEEVKVGVILPFSGRLEETGKAVRSAFELAAEIANNGAPGVGMTIAGWKGIPGLGGRRVRLIVGDHRSEPERGAAIASRFISEERVVGIVGAFTSSVTRSVASVCERVKIPMLTATSTAQALTTQGNRWLWRTSPSNVSRAKSFFSFLRALSEGKTEDRVKVPKEDLQRLCIMAEATEMGDQIADILKAYGPRYGIKPILHIRYPRGASDFSIHARAAARARPSVFAMVAMSEDASAIITRFKELGFAPAIIWGQSRGLREEAFAEALKDDAIGVVSLADFSLKLSGSMPLVGQINDLYRMKTGRDLEDVSALAFTGLQTFLHILDRARSLEPAAIQSAANSLEIRSSELIMPWEGIRFGGEQQREMGQNIMASGIAVQWQPAPETGKPELQIVYPPRNASSQFIYPFPNWYQ
jgi:branched-chain amino acid transport system substrate-binding protein